MSATTVSQWPRLIWENALDGMRLTDQAGTILRVNDAYCRLVGKLREDLEGKPLSVVYEAHRGEEVLLKHRQRFQERTVPEHLESELTLWNGRKVAFEFSNSFLEAEGQPTLLVSMFRDITQRKEAEHREAAFAKLARQLSAASSAAEAASLIGDTADELIGWDALSLGVYLADQDVIYPVINIDLVEGKRAAVPPAYDGKPPSARARQILERGAQLILRQGPYQFSIEGAPFGDTARPSASLMYVPTRLGNKTTGIFSIQSYAPNAYDEDDLNLLQTLADQCAGTLERVRAQEELKLLNAELEQRVAQRTEQLAAANTELEAFSYSVSHDLRAPLRSIDGFSRILVDDHGAKLDEEGKRLLGLIQEATKRMGRLIDALLNFSRLGRQPMGSSLVDMTALAGSVFRELAAHETEATPQFALHPLPPTRADQTLIRQVLVNLLSNAIKFTRGRDLARVEMGSQSESEQNIYYIKDNGVGFDAQYSHKLFRVFQRLHREVEFEGTGVGLALVQRIIKRHGGRVWAEGSPNEGATFYFTIPNQQDDPVLD